MGLCGDLAPCGLWQCGDEASWAEKVYDQLTKQVTNPATGQTAYDLSLGTYQEARYFAWSLEIGAWLATMDRAYAQGDTRYAIEGLPRLEADYQVTPFFGEDIRARQAVLTAMKQAGRGAAYSLVVAAMKALLGANFVAFLSGTDAGASSSVVFPASPVSSPQVMAKPLAAVPKFFKLVDPIASITSGANRWVKYADLDTTNPSQPLAVGDVVMVQGENTGCSEKVTVLDVRKSSGHIASYPGTVSGSSGASTLTGVSTMFTQALAAGSTFWVTDNSGFEMAYAVSAVASDTSLTIVGTFLNTITSKSFASAPNLGAAGDRYFYAAFANAHDVGGTVTSMHFPWQTTPSRAVFVVLKAAIAADPNTVTQTQAILRLMSRVVDTFAVLRDDVSSVPFTFGTSPLGTAALGNVPYSAST